MSTRLIIRFRVRLNDSAEDDLVDWLICKTEEGAIQTGNGKLSAIPSGLENPYVIILIPTLDVLLTQVELPKTKSTHLKKMVPFVLEEYIAEDVSQLHIAMADSNATGKLTVAAIKHSLMLDYLKKLTDAKIYPDSMLPDLWYFPCNETEWVVWVEPAWAFVKMSKEEGFGVDLKNLRMLLDLKKLEFQRDEKPLPEKIQLCFQRGEAYKALQEVSENLHEYQIDKPKNSSDFLEIILENLPQKPLFNLLQPPYLVKKRGGQLKKQWFLVGVLLSLLTCLTLFSKIFEFFFLSHHVSALKKQNLQLYQSNFTGTLEKNARGQLQNELNRLLQTSQGNSFFKKLSQIIPLIKAENVTLVGLEYEKKMLVLLLEVPSMQALNNLIQAFAARKILVDKKQVVQQKHAIAFQLVIL